MELSMSLIEEGSHCEAPNLITQAKVNPGNASQGHASRIGRPPGGRSRGTAAAPIPDIGAFG